MFNVKGEEIDKPWGTTVSMRLENVLAKKQKWRSRSRYQGKRKTKTKITEFQIGKNVQEE